MKKVLLLLVLFSVPAIADVATGKIEDVRIDGAAERDEVCNTADLDVNCLIIDANWMSQTEGNLKAPLLSPALTGTPTAPTPTPEDNSTQVATTAFVLDEVADFDTCAEVTGCVVNAIIATGVTYEQLSTNSDIGFGAAQVPQGSLTAPLANPALSGNPTAPTATTGDSDTSIATTDFVDRRTQHQCKTIEDLVAADDDILLDVWRQNITITAVACESDAAATVVLEAHVGGADVETIVCNTDGTLTWDATIGGTAAFLAGASMRMLTTTTSTPTWTMVCWEWTND